MQWIWAGRHAPLVVVDDQALVLLRRRQMLAVVTENIDLLQPASLPADGSHACSSSQLVGPRWRPTSCVMVPTVLPVDDDAAPGTGDDEQD